MVITRFAPSPTGNLHIGGARTALFNFLYSRSQKGKFLLRIEDTDKERSKKEYEDQIIKSLNWLGINFDENVVYQSSNIDKHKKIAKELFEKKFAYKCYCTNEELDQLMEGKKSGTALRVLALGMTNRLASATRRVLSAKTTDEKLDALAKAISIAGGISAISVAVSGGTKGGLSKIIGLSALKN